MIVMFMSQAIVSEPFDVGRRSAAPDRVRMVGPCSPLGGVI